MSTKKDKEDLVRILISDAIGQIFLCNMLASVSEGLFDRVRLHTLLGHLLHWFQSDRASFTSATSVIGAINKIASGFTSYTSDRCLLACRVSDPKPHASRYAHVCRSDTITTHWRLDNVTSDPDLFLEPTPRRGEEDRYQEVLEAVNDKIREDPNMIEASATLGYDVPVRSLLGLAWITSEDKITSIGSSGDKIRDALGLIDSKPDTFHVVVVFDSINLGAHPIARPTFADGGNTRFRVVPDEPAPRDWGITVDLGKFATGEAIVDGLPERVIPPISLRTITPEFRAVGWVTTTRGTMANDSDAMFVQRLLKNVSLGKSKLKKEILKLFK